jgi:hypothetical protein
MPDLHDEHDEDIVLDLVEHAVVALADAISLQP